MIKGSHHTEEAKKKMSKIRKGKNTGKDNSFYGKHHSKESREKMSKSSKGRIPWNKGKPCSEELKRKLSALRKGEKHPNWNGGQKKDSKGYVLVYKPDHPYAQKCDYVLRSRLVMERQLKRFLNPEEVVHHKNKIVDDDRFENLVLFKSRSEHQSYHKGGEND